MSLLDHGPHTVTVYLEEEVVDSRGNTIRRPSATAVTVSGCWMQPVSSERVDQLSVTQGQRVDASWRLIARDAPVGWWSRVDWAGKRFSVAGGPLVREFSDWTRHVTVTLREER